MPFPPPFFITHGIQGTLQHQLDNVTNSYAASGPTVPPYGVPAFFVTANSIGQMPPYGALDATSGDKRGSALLAGDSGQQV